MANNVITIYKSGNQETVSPGQIVTLGEGGTFDTITTRLYFPSGITSLFEAGSTTKPTGVTGTWVCIGPSDVERLPGGPVIATITWRGLKGSTGLTYSETHSVRETNYDSISGIPGTAGSVKGRLLEPMRGISVRRITTTKPSYNLTQNNNLQIPGVNVPTVQKLTDVINTAKTYTFPYGWICYSATTEEPLPGFYFTSEEWRYEHKVIFGT